MPPVTGWLRHIEGFTGLLVTENNSGSYPFVVWLPKENRYGIFGKNLYGYHSRKCFEKYWAPI